MPASAHNASANSSTPSPDSRPQTGHPAATIVHTRPLKAAHPHTAPAQPRDTPCRHCAAPNFCPHPLLPASALRASQNQNQSQDQSQSQNLRVAQAGTQLARNHTPATETVAQARTRPARNRTTADRNRGTGGTPQHRLGQRTSGLRPERGNHTGTPPPNPPGSPPPPLLMGVTGSVPR